MAKLEKRLTGDFDGLLQTIEREILGGSVSASYEAGSNYSSGDLRCAVRVYERYSAFGGNRVSMNVTLVGDGDNLFISGITSGGSQAMFFKINTFGEESFLDKLAEIVDRYA
jgi:hypothetical protein